MAMKFVTLRYWLPVQGKSELAYTYQTVNADNLDNVLICLNSPVIGATEIEKSAPFSFERC